MARAELPTPVEAKLDVPITAESDAADLDADFEAALAKADVAAMATMVLWRFRAG